MIWEENEIMRKNHYLTNQKALEKLNRNTEIMSLILTEVRIRRSLWQNSTQIKIKEKRNLVRCCNRLLEKLSTLRERVTGEKLGSSSMTRTPKPPHSGISEIKRLVNVSKRLTLTCFTDMRCIYPLWLYCSRSQKNNVLSSFRMSRN
jgi:hypothetical protein